jgi:hypothetical protein
MPRVLRVWFTIAITLVCIGVISLYSPIAVIAIGLLVLIVGIFWKRIINIKYFRWLLFIDKFVSEVPNETCNKGTSTKNNDANSNAVRPDSHNNANDNNDKSSPYNSYIHHTPQIQGKK